MACLAPDVPSSAGRKRLASRERTAEVASSTQLLYPPAGRHCYISGHANHRFRPKSDLPPTTSKRPGLAGSRPSPFDHGVGEADDGVR
jgi:hypothetical protein